MNQYLKIVGITFFTFISLMMNAQVVPEGFTYQGILRGADDLPQGNQTQVIYIGLLENSANGNLAYEETHNISTNEDGWFNLIIGKGIPTTNGTLNNFNEIDWGAQLYYLEVSVDFLGNPEPITLSTEQLFSVPYALYSKASHDSFNMTDLTDVATIGLNEGDILSWNGNNWTAINLNNAVDSVAFANETNSTTYADTALYAHQVLNCDTAIFAVNAGTVLLANTANSTTNADTATYSNIALTAPNSWKLSGNEIDDDEHFIGTTNNANLIFKTDNTERMRITNLGNVGIGINSPSANLHIYGNNGLLLEGAVGLGAIPATGEGARLMWYSGKSALRTGYVSGDQWDDNNTGAYSYAGGYNSKATGDYSFTHGDQSESNGGAASSFGYKTKANGYASFATGIESEANGFASLALGINSIALDTASIAMGYETIAEGTAAVAFGYKTKAIANYTTAMGYKAEANHMGSFIWRSRGGSSIASTTAENQFMAVANGGFEFYSDILATTGVTLEAGGGAWNTVSDRFKKENIESVNGNSILHKIDTLELSTWNYKAQDKNIRHAGPMAQDFYTAFGLGSSDKTITTTDIDGINLAALKELALKTDTLNAKSKKVQALQKDVNQLQSEKAALEQRLQKLEQAILNRTK